MAILQETFPDVALVHVGHDPNETIASTLAELGSKVRQVRLSGIDDIRLTKLYRHAVCLCVPSLYEGFCLPILEAQDRDCPVICSDRSATPEVAGEGAVTFDPRDPQALADALKSLLVDPGLRERLIEAGRTNLGRFSWDKAAREYEAVFRRALSRAKPARSA
jgi:glycosyltransferase involved in cell wall biosynthesis